MVGVAVADNFRQISVPHSTPYCPFPVAAHRTRRADFQHRALQRNHAPRTQNTTTQQDKEPVLRSNCSLSTRLSYLLRYRRCDAEPVYASTSPNLFKFDSFASACDTCRILCLQIRGYRLSHSRRHCSLRIPPRLRLLSSTNITWRLRYYEPLRHPDNPVSSSRTTSSVRATPLPGLPVLPLLSSSKRASANTPVEHIGARVAHFPICHRPSPY